MKLKTVELNGAIYAEVADGKPVFVDSDGKDIAFDAAHTVGTISRLNGEAKTHREAKEAAEARLKGFEGIEDPDAARKAMETVRNLDQGQLVTAGRVEEIKAAAKKAAEEQVVEAARSSGERIRLLTEERDRIQSEYHAERIGGAFSRSKFIGEKIAVPGDMIQAMFGARFKLEGGKLIGHDASGNKLYSRVKHGDLAEFDEALEQMVDAYPYRDSILKGSGSSGSGAQPNRGPGGSKTMSRQHFNSLSPAEQSKAMIQDRVTLVD